MDCGRLLFNHLPLPLNAFVNCEQYKWLKVSVDIATLLNIF